MSVLLVAIAGCGGDSPNSQFPPAAPSSLKSALEIPDGDTVTYDDGAVIDGLYNCSLSNTGLNTYTGSALATGSTADGNAYAPQFYLSVNGKSNGKAEALLVQATDPALSAINGSAEVTYTGNSISGTTSKGGAISVDFAFQMDPATGLDNIVGVGTYVMKGNDSSGNSFSNTVNISCNSIGKI